jgi:hypothetical protein
LRSFIAAMLVVMCATAADAAGRGVTDKALAQAARDARLDQIDDRRNACKDKRRVEDWLKTVVGEAAESIRWKGGACTLVIPENPMDAGSPWCGRAEIAPKKGGDNAVIEVFFEKPAHGKPGEPFAFRASMVTKDGPDYMRNTLSFENSWREMYSPQSQPPDCN